MPCLSFFADEVDAKLLLKHLNSDPEIAYLVPDEHTDSMPATGCRWKAVSGVERLHDGNYTLWHVPSGPLPLLTADSRTRQIEDPWAGWAELRSGHDSADPNFGPAYPGVIRLKLWARHRPYTAEELATLPAVTSWWDGGRELLAVSKFEWSGNSEFGVEVPQTRRWWNRLKCWLAKQAATLATDHPHMQFYAFPSALSRLKAGIDYYSRNWDLTQGIKMATIPP